MKGITLAVYYIIIFIHCRSKLFGSVIGIKSYDSVCCFLHGIQFYTEKGNLSLFFNARWIGIEMPGVISIMK